MFISPLLNQTQSVYLAISIFQSSIGPTTAPKNSIYRLFLEFFNEYGLHQFVATATRHENILDLVFSNDSQFISTIEVYCPISTSDHNVIVLRPNILSNSYNHQPSSTSSYNFKKGNYLLINEYLSYIDWNAVFQLRPNGVASDKCCSGIIIRIIII